MKSVFFISIIITTFLCCSIDLKKSKTKDLSINGKYSYSKEDSTQILNRHLTITLILFKDLSFEENNENVQCFANLPDYAGTYSIKDSILTTYRKNMLNVYKEDTNEFGKRPVFEFINLETSKIDYLIKGDSLINISDKSIRLCKLIVK